MIEVQSHHRSTRFLISLCGEFSSETPEKLLCIFYFKIMVKSQEIHAIKLHQVPSLGFPCDSARKESTCNAGQLDSIPGLERPPGEGIGYQLQYSWASLLGQMVKNPPAMSETWVRSLGWEDPLEEGMATHSSIFAWRIPMDRGAWQAKKGSNKTE